MLALGRVADELGLGALGTGVAEGGTGDVRSADVTGALGSVVGSLAGLLAVAVVVAVWVAAWRSDAEPARVVRDCAAVVAAQLALGRVLSPQFVLWLVPARPARGRAPRSSARAGCSRPPSS